MKLRNTILAVLAALAVLVAAGYLGGQSQRPQRETLDDRLAAMEDRLAELEDNLARLKEECEQTMRVDRLVPESEAKLDRLEVRLIQLEAGRSDCDCGGSGPGSLLERMRSLERQVARLRAASLR